MKKIFRVICGKYRKFKKPKISYILEKTLKKCNDFIDMTEEEERVSLEFKNFFRIRILQNIFL